MLHPAPTSSVPTGVARGVFEERHPETATTPEQVVLSFYNTQYRMHLLPIGEITVAEGKRIEGRIRADAKRVDVVTSGGRYVEPVHGRPRRVQGTIVATDNGKNTITVKAGVPIECRLTDRRQSAAQFEAGQFVSFDVMRGATFEQV
jgi:hypothetical protein